MRQTIVFALLIVGLLTLFGSTAAASIVCKQSNLPSDGIVVYKQSAITNAHGSLFNQTGFTFETRCLETTGVALNNGTQNPVTLFSLSSSTNGHAEEAGQSNYTNDIQVGFSGAPGILDVKVAGIPLTTPTNCSGYNAGTTVYAEVARLSGTTNAHLESINNPLTNYTIQICIAYISSGVAPPDDDIASVIMSGNTPTVTDAGLPITIQSSNLVSSDSTFTNVGTVRLTAMCDMIDPECGIITTYDAAIGEIFTYLSPATAANSVIVPGTQRSNNYDSTNPIYLAAIAVFGNTGNVPFTSPTNNQTYTISPTSVGLFDDHTYRVFTVDLVSQFTKASTTYFEDADERFNNFDEFTITYDADGSGPTTPGCPPNCPPGGAGGDEIALGTMTFEPNLWVQGEGFTLNIPAVNKRMDLYPSGVTIQGTLIIRGEDGVMIPGFDPAPIQFRFEVPTSGTVSSTGATYLNGSPITIEFAGLDNAAFIVGETYTFFAKANVQAGEVISANNSTSGNGVKIIGAEPIGVPDAPWWMSIMMVSIVLGWLFLASRKQEQ